MNNSSLCSLQDDIGVLFQTLQKMRRTKEALALAPEQSANYMRAFAGWQRVNPSTKLGRAPPGKKVALKLCTVIMEFFLHKKKEFCNKKINL